MHNNEKPASGMDFFEMQGHPRKEGAAQEMSPEYVQWVLEMEEHIRAFMSNARNFAVYRLVRNDASPYLADIVFVSPSMGDILGVPDPMQIGLWFEKAHPEDFGRILEAHAAAFETLKINEIIRIFHEPKGQWRWVQIVGTGSLDSTGTTMHANGIIIDVTEQKLVEEAFRESQEKYKDLVENINDVVFSLDDKGACVYISPVVKSLMGYEPEQILGKTLADFVHEDGLPNISQGFADVMSGKLRTSEYKVYDREGSVRWVRSSSRPVKVDDRIVGVRGTFMDITEQKKAEEEKRRLEQQLEQAHKLEAIGTMAGGIAHNLNNVLYPIVGYTEMALEDLPNNSRVRHSLQEVLKAADRAKELVTQILTYSRRTEHTLESVKVTPVLEEVLNLMQATIPATITIERNIQAGEYNVAGEAVQIHQMFMNLCTNAYHAMRDHGGVLRVFLEPVYFMSKDLLPTPTMNLGKYVKITISDTGHGISKEVKDRIFEPYFTTKSVGQGTGMGLALAHAIITKNQGGITVHSEPGKGASFVVYLPVTALAPAQPAPEIPGPPPAGNEHILLVEDEGQILAMNKQMLERLGYRVFGCKNGLEALNAFSQAPNAFDLVITDMTMPAMTGDELAAEVLKQRPDMPIILCTGYSERVSQDLAEALGVEAFMMKPMAKVQVATTIREILDRKKTAAAATNNKEEED